VRSWILLALGSASCTRPTAPTPAIHSVTPARTQTEPTGFHHGVAEFPDGLSRDHFNAQIATSARTQQQWRFAFRGQGWGCTCPDWIIRVAFGDSETQTVYPVLGPTAHDPTFDFYGSLFYAGTYRVLGRFAAERMTGIAWTQLTGQSDSSAKEDASGWSSPEPVILVDDWCFEPFSEPPANMRDSIEAVTRAGLICPGSPTPTYEIEGS